MLDHDGICELAVAMRCRMGDLLALDPVNDPFCTGRAGRLRDAKWFADTCRTLGLGAGLHIRRVHYRASIAPPVPILKPDGSAYENTHTDWKLMVKASRDARYLGLVPAEWFVDRRNDEPVINATFNPETTPDVELIGGALGEMLLPEKLDLPELVLADFNAQQRHLVEVWVEKTTVHDVLVPLARRWRVNLITFMGEGSETACRAAIERGRLADRPLRILYLSDFDPGGRSMPVSIARKIEFWLRKDDALDVTLDPIVLLPEQIERYALPRIPIKETERRAAKFEANFGAGGVELDALEALHPGELKKLVEAGIQRHLDPDLAQREHEAWSEINEELEAVEGLVHDRYRDRISDVQDEYAALREQLAELRARAGGLWQEIADDLEAEAPYVSADDVPDARDESDQLAPLFDSGRDYLTQIDWYRRWQGRAP